MIPHHQGTADLAKIILEQDTDPEVKNFAEDTVAAQDAEIEGMTDRLSRTGG